MSTIQAAVRRATRLLEEAGIAAPRLTAEVLLGHVLGREKSYLFAHPEQQLDAAVEVRFDAMVGERLQGKPTQYITGWQEFYGRPFAVTPDVLIPRPETEHVVERALELKPRRVVDVGTGSGAIAITLQLECAADVYAIDLSQAALRVAAANAMRLGASVKFAAGDVLECAGGGLFDMVVSNPPYVPRSDQPSLQREVVEYEPHLALFGGESGFDIYERLVVQARRVLTPGGWLVMELGFLSAPRVSELMRDFRDVEVRHDLAGLPRVISGRLAP